MRSGAGFTLLELMVAIGITAILATVAVPSFTSMMRNNRSASEANAALSVFTLARSEAIKRNRPVIVCKSSDGSGCVTSGGWQQGAMVFEDTDGNGAFDAGEPVIQAVVPLSSASTITGDSNLANTVTFTSLGRAKAYGRITIKPSGSDLNTRAVILSATRNPRICYPDRSPSDCPSS
jgi:type IV fimbrial biogenesis protein FimT